MVLNRVRPSWYMAGFCMAWSIVSLLTFLAKDYSSMVVLRFFLGVTEAPVSYFPLRSLKDVVEPLITVDPSISFTPALCI